LNWLPMVAGTASHLPSSLPRYSTVPLTLPFVVDQLVHHVVHRHQLLGIAGGRKVFIGQDVVARLGLRLRRRW
jgi:hypothetical protein